MRTFIFSISMLLLGWIGNQKQPEKNRAQPENYQLVWADEFNRNGAPDSANWVYETGFRRNHEAQYYQKENVWCENGKLIIEARKENKANPDFLANSKDWRHNRKMIDYSSGCILTKGKHVWQYGRFEMRAKIDIHPGAWPAWWTLGTTHSWPGNGEIDIMEFYRGKLLANIACQKAARSAEWFSNKFSVDSLGGQKWAEKFHIWRMDWNSQSIALYIDNQLLNMVPLRLLENKDGSGFNPFTQPHYQLLNLAIGGDNGGDPSQTIFPIRFEVDYVRVYQQTSS